MILGSVNKHGGATLKISAVRKCMLLDIMKCIHKFANVKNTGITAYNCFSVLRFHPETGISKG